MLTHLHLSLLTVFLWVCITYLASAKREFPALQVILAIIITLKLLLG